MTRDDTAPCPCRRATRGDIASCDVRHCWASRSFLTGTAEAPRTELCTLLIYSLGEHPTEDRLYSVSYILCVPSVLQVSYILCVPSVLHTYSYRILPDVKTSHRHRGD